MCKRVSPLSQARSISRAKPKTHHFRAFSPLFPTKTTPPVTRADKKGQFRIAIG